MVLPVALLLLAACAAGGRRARPAYEDVLVTVENDLAFRNDVTVRLISSTGARALLGSVSAGASRTFRFQESSFAGAYRLAAEPTSGRTIESPAFSLFPGALVHWELQVNLVGVTEEETPHGADRSERAAAF